MKSSILVLMALMAVVAVVGMTGCEMPWEDDDDDTVEGTSTIQGNVADYQVASAKAGIGGVTVKVEGTDLTATTASDGSFVISGVPAGLRTLIFTYNGVETRYEVTVEDDVRIILSGISIAADGVVSVASVKVEALNPIVATSPKDDEEEATATVTPAPAAPAAATTATMSIALGRGN